jgi:hypothetical protein
MGISAKPDVVNIRDDEGWAWRCGRKAIRRWMYDV